TAAQIMRVVRPAVKTQDSRQRPARTMRLDVGGRSALRSSLLLAGRGRVGFGVRRCFLGLEDGDAERDAHFVLDAATQVDVVFQRLLGVLASLAQPLALVGEPRAGLFDDAVRDREVKYVALARDALA